jgi:hypothetical protein
MESTAQQEEEEQGKGKKRKMRKSKKKNRESEKEDTKVEKKKKKLTRKERRALRREKKGRNGKEEKSSKKSGGSGLSSAVKSILDGSKYKTFEGELTKRSPSRYFLKVAGRRILRISKANREEGFLFRLIGPKSLKEVGLKTGGWKPAGKGKFDFTGDPKNLSKKLRIAFKKVQAAA